MQANASVRGTAWVPPDKIWNPMFLAIFFANMAMNLGQTMSNSLLAKYADSLGAPASQVGVLMSMFAVSALVFRFVAGPALDTFNKKHIIMGAMGVLAIAYVGFSVSETVPSLMVFRLFQGIGNAFGNVCCLAIVADALPKNKFNTGIGYYSCAQVVSQAIGPTVGLQLVDWVGYHWTYIITAAVMLLAVVAALRIQLPPRQPKRFQMHLKNIIAKEALVPASITFFVAMAFTTINALLIVYASKRGVEAGIGLFFTVYALTMLVTRPMVGRLTDRFGFVKVGVPAILMTAVSFVLISLSSNLWMFLLAAFVNAFGYGAVQPALQSLTMKAVPDERRGSASSTNYIGMDSATIVGPTVAGILAETVGYQTMWVLMTIPMFVGVGIVLMQRENIRKIETDFATRVADL